MSAGMGLPTDGRMEGDGKIGDGFYFFFSFWFLD